MKRQQTPVVSILPNKSLSFTLFHIQTWLSFTHQCSLLRNNFALANHLDSWWISLFTQSSTVFRQFRSSSLELHGLDWQTSQIKYSLYFAIWDIVCALCGGIVGALMRIIMKINTCVNSQKLHIHSSETFNPNRHVSRSAQIVLYKKSSMQGFDVNLYLIRKVQYTCIRIHTYETQHKSLPLPALTSNMTKSNTINTGGSNIFTLMTRRQVHQSSLSSEKWRFSRAINNVTIRSP